MISRLAPIAIGAILAAALATAGSLSHPARAADSPSPAPAVVVHLNYFAFKPPTLTIPVGTTVIFVEEDDNAHTVTSVEKMKDKPLFDSGNLDKGQKWSYTFTKPGTYKYVCAYHDFMKATIVVQPAPSST